MAGAQISHPEWGSAEHFEKAAQFFDHYPTGQYDDEAAEALRAYHPMFAALKEIVGSGDATGCNPQLMVEIARAAIAKVTA